MAVQGTDERYAIESTAGIIVRMREILADINLRLTRSEARDGVVDQAAREIANQGVRYIESVISPRAAELEALLEDFREGVPAAEVVEDAEHQFLNPARRSGIIDEVLDALRGDVATAGDSLAKLYDLIANIDVSAQLNTALSTIDGGAPAGRKSLKALSDLIDANASAIVLANSQLAAATAQLAAGVPTMDAFLATAVEIAQLKFGTLSLPDGFVDDYDTAGFIDPASTGYFVDTVSGGVVGGVGGQTFVIENVSSLPQMASNTTTTTGVTGYAAAATTENAGNQQAWNAFDKTGGTGWCSAAPSGAPQSLIFKAPSALRVAAYRYNGNGDYSATSWTFDGSNDPSALTNPSAAWVNLDTQTGVPKAVGLYTIAAANQASYQFYRMRMTAGGHPSDSYKYQALELDLLQYTPAFESHPSLPAMTSNTAPPGHVAFASTIAGASNDAYNAFDGSTSTQNPGLYASAPGSIAGTYVGRQTPTAIKLGGYAIVGYWDGSNSYYPTAWRFQGSNSPNAATSPGGAQWDTLDQRTGQTFSNAGRNMYSIPAINQGLYTTHRIVIDAVNAAPNVNISTLDFLQVLNGIEGQTSIPYHTGPNAVVGGASGYAVSASSTYAAGAEAWRSANGILGADNWAASNGSSTGTWTRQFPAALKVLVYRLWSVGGVNPGSWQLRGSNNGTNWDVLDSRTVGGNFWVNGWSYFVVNAPGSYLYYQMNMLSVVGQSTLAMYDIEFLQGTSGDMNLMSKVYTRNAGVPSKASITLDFKVNAGTLNLNTNVKAQVSRNGGGSYKDVILSLVGPVDASGRVRYRSPPTDLTDQPADNKLKSRVLLTGGMGINLKAQICLGAA